jgi:hypothetical protein
MIITMNGPIAIIALLFLHWVADFVLQSDDMSKKKSSHTGWLAFHCVVYAVVFALLGWVFALWMFVSHFVIDFVTSRINKKLWEAKQVYYFFVSVGFDQLLHFACIFYGAEYLL